MTMRRAFSDVIDYQPIFKAVRQAVALCKRVQEQFLVTSDKGGHEPVTIADYGAQAILSRAISLAFPDDAIIAEESGAQFIELVSDKGRTEITRMLEDTLGVWVKQSDVVKWLDYGRNRAAERTWVIDPIDGTKGFIALRNYVVAVGVMERGKPVGGVIGAPAFPTREQEGALFHAKSGVAYMESLLDGPVKRIRASTRTEPRSLRALESVEKSHANHERMQRVRELAGYSEASLVHIDSMEKYCRIAAGTAELYLRLPRLNSTRPFMVWDHCAGTAIVQAAGGRVTDIDGSPLDFSKGITLPNKGIIVSNARIHDKVITAIQQVLKEEGDS
ncbi:MAG: inositol monophosphatase family protein [Anaerolineae bacterium]